MTWQAASFLILALALAGGFAWYERSRPSARLLALVASLAALTVVGRLAFAAFPNVKPTTDMILLAGYALGAAPGFAVGAITPLVSNIVLTHGPWTPWQMVAWGGVGIAGAGLARLVRGRELSRWTLAVICGVAGFAFGAFMDTYQWTLAAEQTFDSWLAIAATSLPYNVAHAVGNVVFCLAIGPAFVRALIRFRRRFEVRWAAPRPVTAAGVGALLVLALVFAAPASASPSSRALDYLESAQNGDGGFGAGRGQSSSDLYTGWAALGVAAGGRNPRQFQRGGASPIDFMRGRAGAIRDIGELERTILVLRASRLSPRNFGGRNLVAEILRHRRGNGSFDNFISYTAFGVLALRAAGERAGSRRVRSALRWLARVQNRDGGWGLTPPSPSDVDLTGSAVQAFAAGGRRGSRAARRGVRYLVQAQNRDGGFGTRRGRPSNAQSTSYAVQGLIAGGRNVDRVRRGGRSPEGYLRSLQQRDGSVRYSRASAQTPVWVTAQVLIAFARDPFPLRPVRLASGSASDGRDGGKDEARDGRRRGRRERRGEGGGEGGRSERPASAPPAAPISAAPAEPAGARDGGEDGGDEGGMSLATLVGAALGGSLVLAGIWWRRRRRAART